VQGDFVAGQADDALHQTGAILRRIKHSNFATLRISPLREVPGRERNFEVVGEFINENEFAFEDGGAHRAGWNPVPIGNGGFERKDDCGDEGERFDPLAEKITKRGGEACFHGVVYSCECECECSERHKFPGIGARFGGEKEPAEAGCPATVGLGDAAGLSQRTPPSISSRGAWVWPCMITSQLSGGCSGGTWTRWKRTPLRTRSSVNGHSGWASLLPRNDADGPPQLFKLGQDLEVTDVAEMPDFIGRRQMVE